jgi:pilus assembly protein CpaF
MRLNKNIESEEKVERQVEEGTVRKVSSAKSASSTGRVKKVNKTAVNSELGENNRQDKAIVEKKARRIEGNEDKVEKTELKGGVEAVKEVQKIKVRKDIYGYKDSMFEDNAAVLCEDIDMSEESEIVGGDNEEDRIIQEAIEAIEDLYHIEQNMVYKRMETGQLSRKEFIEGTKQSLMNMARARDEEGNILIGKKAEDLLGISEGKRKRAKAKGAEELDCVDEGLADKIMERYISYIWSYDILDSLIADDEISDINCMSHNVIRVKRKGKRELSEVKFGSKMKFDAFIGRVAVLNKVSIAHNNALSVFTDSTTSDVCRMRINISTGIVNCGGGYVMHIRKIPKKKYTVKDLIGYKMMSAPIARYLRRMANSADGILFTGKGASGKTTLMNTMLDLISIERSGLVIQESDELFSYKHLEFNFQHVVEMAGEGKIHYSLQDEARHGLLGDLDYFIIGEIKGKEALHMLNAVYTGHKGWASVHGASSTEAVSKLVDYIKYASDYSKQDAEQMLVHFNTVVFMKNWKVWEISEIERYDNKELKLIYKPIVREGKAVVNIGRNGEVED